MVIPTFVRCIVWTSDNSLRRRQTEPLFCYVCEVVGALSKLRDYKNAFRNVFNIGSNEVIWILQLAKCVKDWTESDSEIVFVTYDEAYEEGFEDMPRRVPDISKVYNLVGFQPQMSLDGILETVIDYQSGRRSASASD